MSYSKNVKSGAAAEWNCYNKICEQEFCKKCELTDRLLIESERVRENVIEVLDTNLKVTNNMLERRITETEFLREEIERIRKLIFLEIEALNATLNRVNAMIHSLSTCALDITHKCIGMRKGRTGVDLFCDQVDIELKAEEKVILGAQGVFNKCKEQIEETLRGLRSSLYFINRDLKDKLTGLVIDTDVLQLKLSNLDLSIFEGSTSLDPAAITKAEWDKFTRNSLFNVSKKLNTSRPLRVQVDKIVQQIEEDLKLQEHNVNEALRRRVEEVTNAKHNMEKQHFEIVRQINELVLEITKIEESIAEKQSYLALAHTRLGRRAQRPGMELVRDEANLSLNHEVTDIKDAISQLEQILMQSRAALRNLLKNQLKLEEGINVKNNTLKIDQVDVLTLRQKIKH